MVITVDGGRKNITANQLKALQHEVDKLTAIFTTIAKRVKEKDEGGRMKDEGEIRERVKEYITRDLIRDPDYPLGDDEGMITEGLMDSFALADFAVFVEREFGVYIPDPELTVIKMNTVNQMVSRIMADRH